MSLHQGRGNSASTPHPFLIPLFLVFRVPRFQGRGRQKRQMPPHVPLTDTSLLSATLQPVSGGEASLTYQLPSCKEVRVLLPLEAQRS